MQTVIFLSGLTREDIPSKCMEAIYRAQHIHGSHTGALGIVSNPGIFPLTHRSDPDLS